ncbi:unnamed protein product [Protopolystoma xenopodis]|uniref:Uncharacterized protein n=1 Tax=Protopolystoma xenopodis TaxID=117903 RepID=A0A448WJ93_9PLAT|nr:unnamed protein product [Protopolystoma xenopodis]
MSRFRNVSHVSIQTFYSSYYWLDFIIDTICWSIDSLARLELATGRPQSLSRGSLFPLTRRDSNSCHLRQMTAHYHSQLPVGRWTDGFFTVDQFLSDWQLYSFRLYAGTPDSTTYIRFDMNLSDGSAKWVANQRKRETPNEPRGHSVAEGNRRPVHEPGLPSTSKREENALTFSVEQLTIFIHIKENV